MIDSTGNPFGLLQINRENSFSSKGMCPKAPDTRHEWKSDGIGAQSTEYLHCVHCRERIVD